MIDEAFERIARKDPTWSVAEWLTEQKVPKTANSSNPAWTEKNVIDLIRRTIYRGVETYRITFAKKEHRTGRHNQVRNEAEKVQYREMPHLRIVPDDRWDAANEAIDSRTLRKKGRLAQITPWLESHGTRGVRYPLCSSVRSTAARCTWKAGPRGVTAAAMRKKVGVGTKRLPNGLLFTSA